MNKHKQTGTLYKKHKLQTLSNIKKFRQFVLYSNGEYIKFNCSQNMCTMLDNFNEQDIISVTFELLTDNVLYCSHIKLIKKGSETLK